MHSTLAEQTPATVGVDATATGEVVLEANSHYFSSGTHVRLTNGTRPEHNSIVMAVGTTALEQTTSNPTNVAYPWYSESNKRTADNNATQPEINTTDLGQTTIGLDDPTTSFYRHYSEPEKITADTNITQPEQNSTTFLTTTPKIRQASNGSIDYAASHNGSIDTSSTLHDLISAAFAMNTTELYQMVRDLLDFNTLDSQYPYSDTISVDTYSMQPEPNSNPVSRSKNDSDQRIADSTQSSCSQYSAVCDIRADKTTPQPDYTSTENEVHITEVDQEDIDRTNANDSFYSGYAESGAVAVYANSTQLEQTLTPNVERTTSLYQQIIDQFNFTSMYSEHSESGIITVENNRTQPKKTSTANDGNTTESDPETIHQISATNSFYPESETVATVANSTQPEQTSASVDLNTTGSEEPPTDPVDVTDSFHPHYSENNAFANSNSKQPEQSATALAVNATDPVLPKLDKHQSLIEEFSYIYLNSQG